MLRAMPRDLDRGTFANTFRKGLFANNLPEDINRAIGPRLFISAHRRFAKEDAEGISIGPIGQRTNLDNLPGIRFQIDLAGYLKIYLLSPDMSRSLKWQALIDNLCRVRIVQLCSYREQTTLNLNFMHLIKLPPCIVTVFRQDPARRS